MVPKNKEGHYKTLTAASTPCCNVRDCNCNKTYCTIHTLLQFDVFWAVAGTTLPSSSQPALPPFALYTMMVATAHV